MSRSSDEPALDVGRGPTVDMMVENGDAVPAPRREHHLIVSRGGWMAWRGCAWERPGDEWNEGIHRLPSLPIAYFDTIDDARSKTGLVRRMDDLLLFSHARRAEDLCARWCGESLRLSLEGERIGWTQVYVPTRMMGERHTP